MAVSKKYVDELKEIYKDKEGGELNDQEAQEVADGLVGFVEILWKMSEHQVRLKARLKKEPKGFPVDGHYTCIVCYRSIDPETGWYDHNNQKCLSCQKAVDSGLLPAFVCHHRSSFFLSWELKSKFNVHSATARKMVRQGKLTARIIRNEESNSDEYVFLKKENPQLIERYNPVRKSYDRNRNKVSDRRVREEVKKMREERAAEEKKFRERIRRIRAGTS